MGVRGKLAVFGTAPFSPSPAFEAKPVTEDSCLWPRRKAVDDGGGKGLTSAGGEVDFGGDGLRKVLTGALLSGGGET